MRTIDTTEYGKLQWLVYFFGQTMRKLVHVSHIESDFYLCIVRDGSRWGNRGAVHDRGHYKVFVVEAEQRDDQHKTSDFFCVQADPFVCGKVTVGEFGTYNAPKSTDKYLTHAVEKILSILLKDKYGYIDATFVCTAGGQKICRKPLYDAMIANGFTHSGLYYRNPNSVSILTQVGRVLGTNEVHVEPSPPKPKPPEPAVEKPKVKISKRPILLEVTSSTSVQF